MSSQRKPRSRKPSRWALTLRLRWSRFWTSWRLKRLQKKLAAEMLRLTLLEQSLDSSHLRIKELRLSQQTAQNRLVEMAESRQFRSNQMLLPATSSTPELDQALGLSTPQA